MNKRLVQKNHRLYSYNTNYFVFTIRTAYEGCESENRTTKASR